MAGRGSRVCMQEEQLRKGDSVGSARIRSVILGRRPDPGPIAALNKTILYGRGGAACQA